MQPGLHNNTRTYHGVPHAPLGRTAHTARGCPPPLGMAVAPEAGAQQQQQPVELVIFDLDGTLVDTESLVKDVCRDLAENHFRVEYTPKANEAGLGMVRRQPQQRAALPTKGPRPSPRKSALCGVLFNVRSPPPAPLRR